MTKCVGEAWEIFNRDGQEVIIKSFRCLGISLPVDGSCDSELSIKVLETSVLSEGIKQWAQLPVAPAGNNADIPNSGGNNGSNSDSASDSNSGSDSDSDSDSDSNNGGSSDNGIIFASRSSSNRPILAPQTIDSATT